MLTGFLVDGDDTTVIGAMWGARVRDRRTRLHPGERGGCGWSHRGAGEALGARIVTVLLQNRTKQGVREVRRFE
jgi:hypothetical protein